MFLKRTVACALLSVVLASLLFCSCKKFDGDVTVPSYIHIDRIDVVAQSHDAPSTEDGFYTSLIDAVQLVCYFAGDTAETSLGTFQLPCSVPVLRSGTMSYLTVVPCVKQNGISGTRIQYPYYQTIRLTDVKVSSDSVTNVGTFSPVDGLWHLEANYYPTSRMTVAMEEYFEPTTFNILFDSVMEWVRHDPDAACTGQGYGRVHVSPSDKTLRFCIDKKFDIPSNEYVYLEMDYYTDVQLKIYMDGYLVNGGNNSWREFITLYPNRSWQKIYINLGKVWSQFNYNSPFSVFFYAVNDNGSDGYVRFDNVKIVTIR